MNTQTKTLVSMVQKELGNLTEKTLLSAKVGVTSDEGESISEVGGHLGRVFWSYREPKDSLGRTAVVTGRNDADHILVCKIVNGMDVFADVKLS